MNHSACTCAGLSVAHHRLPRSPCPLLPPAPAQIKPLTIRNVSPLPLTFSLRALPPFTLDRASWLLEPEESGTVNINFDPEFRGDLQVRCVRLPGGATCRCVCGTLGGRAAGARPRPGTLI